MNADTLSLPNDDTDNLDVIIIHNALEELSSQTNGTNIGLIGSYQ